MTIRFGVSPIAWANDDMPELGADTTVETILDDAAAIGFAGVELGGRFPREPAVLGPMLARRKLALVGGWYSLNLLTRDAEAEIAALQAHLALLKAMGADVFIAAETSNAIHGERAIPLADAPRLAAGDWPRFGGRLAAVAAHIEREGLRFAYHFHLGTVVEREADVDAFIAATPDSVGFVVDTGHAALGGVDAAALVRAHPQRIAHVHAKDIRQAVFARISAERRSFLDGVLAGMFTAPGDGDLDFSEMLRALADIRYDGWIVIEAEQDPELADPRVYSRLGMTSLRTAAAAAGLIGSSQAAE
ncbi:MAG TPA: myo-inosose-2 dehydratase [Caulobacteraceae bacterium]